MATDRQIARALSQGASNICIDRKNLESPFIREALKFYSKQLKTVSVETEGEIPEDIKHFLEQNKLRLG